MRKRALFCWFVCWLGCAPSAPSAAPPVGAVYLDTLAFLGKSGGEPFVAVFSVRRSQHTPEESESEAKLFSLQDRQLRLLRSETQSTPGSAAQANPVRDLWLRESPCPSGESGCFVAESAGKTPVRIETQAASLQARDWPEARAGVAVVPARAWANGSLLEGVAFVSRVASLHPPSGSYFGAQDQAFLLDEEGDAYFLAQGSRTGRFSLVKGRTGDALSLSWSEIFHDDKTGRNAPSSWNFELPGLGLSGSLQARGGHLAQGKKTPSGTRELFGNALVEGSISSAEGPRAVFGWLEHIQDN
jgi:hypothetical protein